MHKRFKGKILKMLEYIKKLFCSNSHTPKDDYGNKIYALANELYSLSRGYITEEDLPGYKLISGSDYKEISKLPFVVSFTRWSSRYECRIYLKENDSLLIFNKELDENISFTRGNWDGPVLEFLKDIISKYKEVEVRRNKQKEDNHNATISKFNKLFEDKQIQG
jgi:hypothetical protein